MHRSRSTRRALRTLGAVVLAATLLACGTTEDPADTGASAGASGSGSASGSGTSTASASGTAPATADDPSASASATVDASASGRVAVSGATGEVELEQPASAVVALEWGLVENLLSLGVEPIGIADVAGYNTWNHVLPIAEDTPDVGTRGEPSLDAIAALEPDLVVTTTDLPENVISQVSEIAPVLALAGSDATDPIGHMERTVETLATATGTVAAADTLLADFRSRLEEGAATIEEAGVAGREFVMTDAYLNNDQVSIRLHTPGSLLGAIGEELGMVNAWPDGGDPVYGLASTDVEGLTDLGAVEFLYEANDDFGPNPITEGLAGNQVWESLPFVQSGDVHRIPDGIWLFGGPAAGTAFVDAFVDAVTA